MKGNSDESMKTNQEDCSTHPVLYPGLPSTPLGDFLDPFGDKTLISTHGGISLGHGPFLV